MPSSFAGEFFTTGASLMAQWAKDLPIMQETYETGVQSLGWEDPLEKERVRYDLVTRIIFHQCHLEAPL